MESGELKGKASDGGLRLSGFGESKPSVVLTSGHALTALRLLTFTRQDLAEAREPTPDYSSHPYLSHHLVPLVLSSH